MKTIRLFGDLTRYRKEWQLDVETPAEALRAINANRPGFIAACDAGDYVALLFSADYPELIRQVDMHNANSAWGPEELHIIPRAGGDVPVADVAAAFSTLFSVELTGIALYAVTAIINIGLALAFSALANLITGKPKVAVNNPSFIVNGVVNVTNEGTPYPIIAGEFLCGSIVLSSRIFVADVAINAATIAAPPQIG